MAKKKDEVKFKKADLVSAYDELDEVAEVEPPIDHAKLSLKEFEEELHDAYVELSLGEDDEYTEKTQKTFDGLIEKYGKEVIHSDEEEEEEEEEETDEPELEETEEEEPEEEEEDEPEPEPAPKPVKKETKKAPKEEVKNPYTRVDALMEALNEKPKTMKDWAAKAEKLFVKNEGKNKPSNFSKENLTVEFLVKLAEVYNLGIVPLV
jgi:outer membrane biosynthesis protein TonB